LQNKKQGTSIKNQEPRIKKQEPGIKKPLLQGAVFSFRILHEFSFGLFTSNSIEYNFKIYSDLKNQ